MTQAFNLSQLANNLNTSGQLDATDGLTGAVPVANGGTGQTSLSANAVVLGNGTSAVQTVAPSTSGNILTSNGTTWVSQAPSGGGVTSLNGQTGAITNTTFGVIGSYIIGTYFATTEGGELGRITYNATTAGTNIIQTNNSNIIGGGTYAVATNSSSYWVKPVSGTWRCMTSVRPNQCDTYKFSTLWVRIS